MAYSYQKLKIEKFTSLLKKYRSNFDNFEGEKDAFEIEVLLKTTCEYFSYALAHLSFYQEMEDKYEVNLKTSNAFGEEEKFKMIASVIGILSSGRICLGATRKIRVLLEKNQLGILPLNKKKQPHIKWVKDFINKRDTISAHPTEFVGKWLELTSYGNMGVKFSVHNYGSCPSIDIVLNPFQEIKMLKQYLEDLAESYELLFNL